MSFTDLGRSRGIQFRPLSKIAFFLFVTDFLLLMVIGAKHVESPFIELGQFCTAYYFAHFLIIVPVVSLLENSLIELCYKNSSKSGLFNFSIRDILYSTHYFVNHPLQACTGGRGKTMGKIISV